MIRQAIALTLIVLVLGIVVAVRTRDRTVRMIWVVPLWIGAACAVVLGGASAYYVSGLRDYDACTARVDRAAGSRAQTIALYDRIDQATGTTKWTSDPPGPGQLSLRAVLDVNLPPLEAADCVHP